MCDPFTIALLVGGTLASVAGGQITSNENSKQAAAAAKARNDVLNKTVAKNQVFADQSRDVFNRRVTDINDSAATDIATQQADRTANMQANIPTAQAPQSVVMPSSSPQVVKSGLAQKLAEVFGESSAQAERTGKLSGFGSFFQNQGIADDAAGRDVGVNADTISGNMRLMPAMMDYAQIAAHKPSSGIGQILSALGGMATSAAGAKGLGVGAPGGDGFLKPGVGPNGMGFTHFGGPR